MHYSRAERDGRELLATKIEITTVKRVVHTGQEGRFVRAKKKRQRRDFVGLSHPSNRLRMRKFGEHFIFEAWIMLADVSINERRVNSGGRNAVAADVAGEVILGNRIGHGDHGAFAH